MVKTDREARQTVLSDGSPGKGHRHGTGAARAKGEKTVLTQMSGAFLRAVAVMVLITAPSVLIPGTPDETRQMAALVAFFAGALTFAEYSATYPGVVEFRDARPYNRTRFAMLAVMVVCITITSRSGVEHSTLSALLEALAYTSGIALDFPYSPVRLLTLMLGEGLSDRQLVVVRSAAGVAYMTVLLTLLAFIVMLRIKKWPANLGAFNVWVNLPTFDPTAGGDVVARLERDARSNLMLGFILPFVIPAIMKVGGLGSGAIDVTSAQTLTWTVTAWAFLPASLFMRGIAMGRIAAMIREKRREGSTDPSGYASA